MQDFEVGDEPPYTRRHERCGHCHYCRAMKHHGKTDLTTGFSQAVNACTRYVERYFAYKNTMQVIRHNFREVTKQNSDLKQQIEQLNKQNAALQQLIEQNNAAQIELKAELAATRSELKTLDSSLSSLSTRLQSILSFIPTFARSLTGYFTRFIVAAQTQTLDTFEQEELPQLDHQE